MLSKGHYIIKVDSDRKSQNGVFKEVQSQLYIKKKLVEKGPKIRENE